MDFPPIDWGWGEQAFPHLHEGVGKAILGPILASWSLPLERIPTARLGQAIQSFPGCEGRGSPCLSKQDSILQGSGE